MANWFETPSDSNTLVGKFVEHLAKQGLSFGTKAEHQFRFELFKKKDGYIVKWNSNTENTHQLGHNKFSTWTDDEMKGLFRQRTTTDTVAPENSDSAEVDIKNLDIPTSIDWNAKGAVTPPGDQLTCGSYWAFAAVAAIESANFIKNGKLVKLSEQQCLDCTSDGGCGGGTVEDCLEYVQDDNALETEAKYPYKNFKNDCWDGSGSVKISSYTRVAPKSASQLQIALAKQPVAVALDGSQYPFVHYFSGIITTTECGTASDHAALAVGYGVENGTEYFLVKNSWGSHWGEEGYLKIGVHAGDAGYCGI